MATRPDDLPACCPYQPDRDVYRLLQSRAQRRRPRDRGRLPPAGAGLPPRPQRVAARQRRDAGRQCGARALLSDPRLARPTTTRAGASCTGSASLATGPPDGPQPGRAARALGVPTAATPVWAATGPPRAMRSRPWAAARASRRRWPAGPARDGGCRPPGSSPTSADRHRLWRAPADGRTDQLIGARRRGCGQASQRVRSLRIDPQLADGPDQLLATGRAGQAQAVERGVGDLLRAHLEVDAQRLARVAAAEAIGPQHGERAGRSSGATMSGSDLR